MNEQDNFREEFGRMLGKAEPEPTSAHADIGPSATPEPEPEQPGTDVPTEPEQSPGEAHNAILRSLLDRNTERQQARVDLLFPPGDEAA